jgi:hypothetical protein
LREFEERAARKPAEIERPWGKSIASNPAPSQVHFTQDSQDPQTLLDLQDPQGTHKAVRETEEGPDLFFPDPSLPLRLFIPAAADSEILWHEEEVQSAEYASLVEWKRGWHFIRLLRGHPELRDLDRLTALKKLNLIFEELGWSNFEEIGCGDSDFDATFLRCWNSIRCVPGESPLDSAVRLANRYPLGIGGDDLLPYYCKVLSIAGWLQFTVGDRPIALATRMLAELVGCSHRSIATYLKMAQEDGFLDLVKKYPRTKAGGMAYEYRFHIERWQILKSGPP